MRRKVFLGLLAAEAVVCIVFAIVQTSFAGAFSAVTAFPFEQIGRGLRALSLSGGPGNAAAVAIYIAAGLSPAAALLFICKKRKMLPEDVLLIFLSVSLFAVLYLMVNPGVLGAMTGGAPGLTVGKSVLGVIVYSVICGYFVLRVIRLSFGSGPVTLTRYMSLMLGVLGAVFTYMAFGYGFRSLITSVAELRAGNIGNEHLLGASCVFLVMRYAVEVTPYVLNIWLIMLTLLLLEELKKDPYSSETVRASDRISGYCAVALAVTTLSGIGFNLLQLMMLSTLRTINVSVNIPVLSIVFLLAALMLTRFVSDNKRLKDENDAFI